MAISMGSKWTIIIAIAKNGNLTMEVYIAFRFFAMTIGE
jgi:hypothetical protein